MSSHRHIMSSESVTEGHPDKIADQISDAVLDAILTEDNLARVACETLVTTGMVIVAGEITTKAYVHVPDVVRDTVQSIGYDSGEAGFDFKTCAVLSSIDRQSADIAPRLDERSVENRRQSHPQQGADEEHAPLVDLRDAPPRAPVREVLGRQRKRAAGMRELHFVSADGRGDVAHHLAHAEAFVARPVRDHQVAHATRARVGRERADQEPVHARGKELEAACLRVEAEEPGGRVEPRRRPGKKKREQRHPAEDAYD